MIQWGQLKLITTSNFLQIHKFEAVKSKISLMIHKQSNIKPKDLLWKIRILR
jgi:hypothetical protein